MKKALLLAFTLFFTFPSVAFAFDDSIGHLNQEAIDSLKEDNVIQGYDDGTYRPDDKINRAEFSRIVLGSLNTEYDGKSQCFPDVQFDWYALYVCEAKSMGIVDGYPDGHFRPDSNVNLAEALKIILEAHKVPLAQTYSEWYEPYYYFMQDNGLLTSVDSSIDHEITRGEMAQLIFNLGNFNKLTHESEIPPPSVIASDKPKKFLTHIVVGNAGDVQGYGENSWEFYVGGRKYNDDIQIYDVAMWDNFNPNNPNKISVYKFDSSFDPFREEYRNGGEAWVEHRESFNILDIELPFSCGDAQGEAYYACSRHYLEVFSALFKQLLEDQPAEHYGLSYLGHGLGDGSIFGGALVTADAQSLLSYTKSLIGKKIDFLDWGYACSMGSYSVISSQYEYADYMLSSDLIRNNYYVLDNMHPWGMLGHFFSKSETIEESLTAILNRDREIWEVPVIKADMISLQRKQSLCFYDLNKYEDLAEAVNLDEGMQSENDYVDVLDYIDQNYPNQRQKFFDVVHCVNNKDFFDWDLNYSGLSKN